MPYELRGNRDCGWQKLGTNYFTFTSINKVSQFFFFLAIAAEKKHIIQNSSRIHLLTVLLIRTKKMKAEQTGSAAAGAEKLHLKATSITRLCMYCYN